MLLEEVNDLNMDLAIQEGLELDGAEHRTIAKHSQSAQLDQRHS